MFRKWGLIALCLGGLALPWSAVAESPPCPNVSPTAQEDDDTPNGDTTFTLAATTNMRAGETKLLQLLPIPGEVYLAATPTDDAAWCRSTCQVAKAGSHVYGKLTQTFSSTNSTRTATASGSAPVWVYVQAGTNDPTTATLRVQRYQTVTVIPPTSGPINSSSYVTFGATQQAAAPYTNVSTETVVVTFGTGETGQWVSLPVSSSGYLVGEGQMTVDTTVVATVVDCEPTDEGDDAGDDEAEPDPCTGPCCGGPTDDGGGLHMRLTTGEIWTEVPVLTLFAEGEEELDVTMRYHSGLRNNATHGWSCLQTEGLEFETQGAQVTAVTYIDASGRRNRFVAVYDTQYTNNFLYYITPIGRKMELRRVSYQNATHHEIRYPNGESRLFGEWGSASEGALILSTDMRGKLTEYGYDPNTGQLTSITTAHGRQVTFGYTGTRLTSITGPGSKVTTLGYDATTGDLLSITDPDNHTQSFVYDTDHRITEETLKNGTGYTAEYSSNDRVIRDVNGEIVVRVQSPTGFPNLRSSTMARDMLTYTDGRGAQWLLWRDNLGRLEVIQNAAASYGRVYSYGGPSAGNDRNRLVEIQNERGGIRSFVYDANGNMTSRQDEAGDLEQFQYAASWPFLLTQRTAPGDRVWAYAYNGYGDVTQITDPLVETPTDHVIQIAHVYYGTNEGLINKPGRLKQKDVTDRSGTVTRYEYDANGNLTRLPRAPVTGDRARVTEFTYDGYGRPLTRTVTRDATTSTVTTWTYDSMGRPLTSAETIGTGTALTTTFAYDGHGLLLSLTNPRGVVSVFEYNERNFLERVTEDCTTGGLNRQTSYVVDGKGNVLELHAPDGGVTYYQYNAAGHLTQVTDAEGYVTELEPDPVGMVTKLTRHLDLEAEGATYVESYTYDAINRLLSKTIDPGTSHVNAMTTYDYTPASGCSCSTAAAPGQAKPNRIEDANQKVTLLEYDALDRVTRFIRKIGDQSAAPNSYDAITNLEYDPMGNLTAVVGPEGERVEFVYDAANRRTEAHAILATSPQLDELVFLYQYDGAGNLIGLTRPEGSQITLEYDLANRLTRALDDTSSVLTRLTYDANGNVLTRASGLHDANNQLTQVWTYTYDNLDRLTHVYEPQYPTQPIVTAYDDVNRRVDVQDRLGRTTRREFDQLGRLIHLIENYRTSGGDGTENTTTTYGYNGARQVSLTDSDNNTTTYAYDTALRLATVNYPDHPDSATGQINYTHDAIGHTLTRTDQRGVQTTYAYDDLGKLASRSYVWSGHTSRSESFYFNRSGRLLSAENNPYYSALYFGYDGLGRLTETAQDYLSAITEEYLVEYGYALDTTNHETLRSLTYPSARVATSTFDSRSRLKEVTGGTRIGAEWYFDDANRRVAAVLGNGAESGFAYDLNNRLTQIQHLVDREADPFYDIQQGYDLVGNLVWKRDNILTDRSESYSYDQRNRLTGFARGELYADPTLGIQTPNTNTLGMPRAQDWLNLDSRGNWLGLSTNVNGTTTAETRALANPGGAANEYDQIAQTIGGTPDPATQRLTYDAAGNLLQIDVAGDCDCDGQVTVYDADSLQYALDYGEQAWQDLFGGAAPCPYRNLDVNGDGVIDTADLTALQARIGAHVPAACRFEYDEESRLTRVRSVSSILLTLKYDALGRRVETIDYQDGCTEGRRTRHILAGLETIAEYVYTTCTPSGGATLLGTTLEGEAGELWLGGELDGGDAQAAAGGGTVPAWMLAREYVWGATFTEPIALIDYTSAGDKAAGVEEVLHYVHDAQGSVVGLLDAGDPDATPAVSAKEVERYTYDPYGTTYIETWNSGTGTWAAPTSGRSKYGNPFMWTGQRYDPGVKLYHFPFRTYSPQLGRWLQRDPAGYVDGTNLYQYVMSMPTGFTDPLGLDPWDLDADDRKILTDARAQYEEAERQYMAAVEEYKQAMKLVNQDYQLLQQEEQRIAGELIQVLADAGLSLVDMGVVSSNVASTLVDASGKVTAEGAKILAKLISVGTTVGSIATMIMNGMIDSARAATIGALLSQYKNLEQIRNRMLQRMKLASYWAQQAHWWAAQGANALHKWAQAIHLMMKFGRVVPWEYWNQTLIDNGVDYIDLQEATWLWFREHQIGEVPTPCF